jgi:hypothetical protein
MPASNMIHLRSWLLTLLCSEVVYYCVLLINQSVSSVWILNYDWFHTTDCTPSVSFSYLYHWQSSKFSFSLWQNRFSGLFPLQNWSRTMTLKDSWWPPWAGHQSVASPLQTQGNTNTDKTQTYIETSSGIWNYSPSVRASEDISCSKPRGLYDQRAENCGIQFVAPLYPLRLSSSLVYSSVDVNLSKWILDERVCVMKLPRDLSSDIHITSLSFQRSIYDLNVTLDPLFCR